MTSEISFTTVFDPLSCISVYQNGLSIVSLFFSSCFYHDVKKCNDVCENASSHGNLNATWKMKKEC